MTYCIKQRETTITYPLFRLVVGFDCSLGTPGVMYLPGGDPDYLRDLPEIEITSCLLEVKAGETWLATKIDLEAIDALDELGIYDSVIDHCFDSIEGDEHERFNEGED